jgi:hypothetical protein
MNKQCSFDMQAAGLIIEEVFFGPREVDLAVYPRMFKGWQVVYLRRCSK